MNIKALIATKNNKSFETKLSCIEKNELISINKDDEVLLEIMYSSLNYKDALAITNTALIAKTTPLVLGIDCIGKIVYDNSNKYKKDDLVFVNGFGIGEKYFGGFAQYAKLDVNWLLSLPKTLTAWESMAIGTAGYTAALCVLKIIDHKVPIFNTNILVTGATGGVGSIAIMLLSSLGYNVVAATTKTDKNDYLYNLGASKVINTAELAENNKPLQKEIWDGAIDTVGSSTLANICAQTKYQGIVACCGLAQGLDFHTTVAPFILRGITLAGVDSVMLDLQSRMIAWNLLINNINKTILKEITQTISLKQTFNIATQMIAGKTFGRYVVDVNK